MFAVDDIKRACATHGNSGGPSLTSLPRKWGVPAKSKKEPIPVKMLEVTKPKYNHTGRGVNFIKLCWHMCIDNCS